MSRSTRGGEPAPTFSLRGAAAMSLGAARKSSASSNGGVCRMARLATQVDPLITPLQSHDKRLELYGRANP
jgi:hypothetical protein